MQNVMIWYTYTVCVQQLSNRESCWHPRSPSSFFHAEGSPTAEHLPGHCCVKPMLISPIPKQKYFPTKKNGAITAIYHIYNYINILYRGFRPGIHQNLSRPRCHRLDSPWWDPLSNSHGSHAASDPPLETGRCRPPQAPGDRTQLLCSENSIQTNRCSKAAG